jgi:hypothetical protein
MTTDTISAAKAANGLQMEAALNLKANPSFAERARGVAGKAKGTLMRAVKALHLGGFADAVKSASAWAWKYAAKAGTRIKGLGLTNVAGAVVTTPLRHKAYKVVKTVVKVVTYPVRLIGRGLRWGLSKFGWGRKVVAKVTEKMAQVEQFVDTKVEAGLTWLDDHDDHGAMGWLRWFFQASLARKAIRMVFPQVPSWAIYAASLAIPVYGDKKHPAEEAAIAKAKEVLADVPQRDEAVAAAAAAPAEKPAAEQPKGHPTPKRSEAKIKGDTVKVPVMTPSQVVLVDKDKPEAERTFEAIAFTDENGVRRIRLGDSQQLLLEEDLPDNITVVGEHLGEVGELIQDQEARNAHEATKLESEVRTAQATPSGRPPTLPRKRSGSRAKKAATTR